MASIIGADLSHWNNQKDVSEVMNTAYDFVILKATEGKKTIDDKCSEYYKKCIEHNKIVGFYHYARPEYNNMEDEVIHFISTVKNITALTANAKYFLALDWEGKAHNCDKNKAKEFLDKVYKLTGIRALFYTNQYAAAKYDFLAKSNYGLWVARYNSTIGDVGAWKTPAIWQYTNEPFDKNQFFGTREQLLKYCEPDEISCVPGEGGNIPGTDNLACYFECGNLDKCPIARWINGVE